MKKKRKSRSRLGKCVLVLKERRKDNGKEIILVTRIKRSEEEEEE